MNDPACSLPLWPETPPLWNPSDERQRPWLDWFPHPDGGRRGCLLVFPGGGYSGRAEHEGRPIALKANEAGFHAAVCHYRVQWHEDFCPLGRGPLYDAQRAIRLLRSKAAEWGIGKLATLGFSAGGHLCGSTGVHGDCEPCADDDLAGSVSAKPDAFAPCYAVLLAKGDSRHQGSIRNLLGDEPVAADLDFFALEENIKPDTPPCFLWHTAEDGGVPVANSLLFAAACRANEVAVELHVFPHGKHGLGLAGDLPDVAQWWPLCANWLGRVIA